MSSSAGRSGTGNHLIKPIAVPITTGNIYSSAKSLVVCKPSAAANFIAISIEYTDVRTAAKLRTSDNLVLIISVKIANSDVDSLAIGRRIGIKSKNMGSVLAEYFYLRWFSLPRTDYNLGDTVITKIAGGNACTAIITLFKSRKT